jgi:hypothetical protein
VDVKRRRLVLVCRGDGSVTASVEYRDVTAHVAGGTLALPGIDLFLCPDEADQVIDASFQSDSRSPDPAPPPAGTPGTLVATFERWPAPVAGTVVSFVIVLSNPTATDVRLDPCPAYQEGAYPSILTYRLNCDAVSTIPAGQHVRFEMKARLAPDAVVAKFFWHLAPDGPYAKG